MRPGRLGRMIAGAVLLVAVATCGGDSDPQDPELRAEMRDRLIAEAGLSEEYADCFAGLMVEEIDHDTLREALSAEGTFEGEAPEEMQTVVVRAADECLDESDLPSTTAAPTTTTGAP